MIDQGTRGMIVDDGYNAWILPDGEIDPVIEHWETVRDFIESGGYDIGKPFEDMTIQDQSDAEREMLAEGHVRVNLGTLSSTGAWLTLAALKRNRDTLQDLFFLTQADTFFLDILNPDGSTTAVQLTRDEAAGDIVETAEGEIRRKRMLLTRRPPSKGLRVRAHERRIA